MEYPNHNVQDWVVGTSSHGIDKNSLIFLSDYFASLFNGASRVGPLPGPLLGFPGVNSVTSHVSTYAQRPAGSDFWDTLSYTVTTYVYKDIDDVTEQTGATISNIVTSTANWARDYYFTSFLEGQQAVYSGAGKSREGKNTYRIRAFAGPGSRFQLQSRRLLAACLHRPLRRPGKPRFQSGRQTVWQPCPKVSHSQTAAMRQALGESVSWNIWSRKRRSSWH